MRTFEHFPVETECPICGTNDDSLCFLLPIDGTQEENLCQCAPAHVHCITDNVDKLRYNRDMGVIYFDVFAMQAKERRLKNERRNPQSNERTASKVDKSVG